MDRELIAHHQKRERFLRPDRTLWELVREMTGIFKALGFRAGRTNGKYLTIADWTLLREQFRAIEIIAGHAKASCDRALREGPHA